MTLAIIFLIQGLAYAQHTRYGMRNGHRVGGVKLTAKEEALAAKYTTCYNSHKYNADQRRAFFPFNQSANIKLISFSSPSDVNEASDDNPYVYTAIASGNYKLNYKRVKESVELSPAAIDSLTDILYNVGYTPVKISFYLSDPGTPCYDPHNAILFIDAKGTVTQYMEFCFKCSRYYLSSSKIKNTIYCDQKYEMLRAFFVNHGVRYSTQKEN